MTVEDAIVASPGVSILQALGKGTDSSPHWIFTQYLPWVDGVSAPYPTYPLSNPVAKGTSPGTAAFVDDSQFSTCARASPFLTLTPLCGHQSWYGLNGFVREIAPCGTELRVVSSRWQKSMWMGTVLKVHECIEHHWGELFDECRFELCRVRGRLPIRSCKKRSGS